MEETKENQKVKKGKRREKHKEKLTIGDKIFRIIILVCIFLICLLAYVFYIKNI